MKLEILGICNLGPGNETGESDWERVLLYIPGRKISTECAPGGIVSPFRRLKVSLTEIVNIALMPHRKN